MSHFPAASLPSSDECAFLLVAFATQSNRKTTLTLGGPSEAGNQAHSPAISDTTYDSIASPSSASTSSSFSSTATLAHIDNSLSSDEYDEMDISDDYESDYMSETQTFSKGENSRPAQSAASSASSTTTLDGDEEYDAKLRQGLASNGVSLRNSAHGSAGASVRRRVGLHTHKRRHRTSAEQLRILEMTYAGNKVPNQELRKDLALQLGMTTRRVQIWFQNKRAKEKRVKAQAQQTKSVPMSLPASLPTSPVSSPPATRPGSLSAAVVPSTLPSRAYPPAQPPMHTMSNFFGAPSAESARAAPSGLPMVAWLPNGTSPLYYPAMMSMPQMHMGQPSSMHPPMSYPSMWPISPLR